MDDLQNYLSENGVATGFHYAIPIHEQKCFEHLGYKKGVFPITENLAETGISLPMYAELNDEQLNDVTGHIKKFFTK